METKNIFQMHQDIQFQTPHFVCEYMVSMLPGGIKTVLEPTPGIGNLVSSTLHRFPNLNICAPDDFFLMDSTKRFDAVIMNPPFTSKSADLSNAPEEVKKVGMRLGYYILEKCLKLSDNVIALMPWFTISDSDLRLQTIKKFGLISVTPLPRKTFRYARIQTVVLEMKRGFSGITQFKTIFHE